MKAKKIPGIPQQRKGGFHDTEAKRYYDNPIIADEKFSVLKKRFFDVNHWRNFCGENSTDFKLCDFNGNDISRNPEIGDLVKIDIPGPGKNEGNSFDWVKITNISHEVIDSSHEKFLITCSPAKDPFNTKNNHIAHFYGADATSNFMICKNKNCINAAIYGRNEVPNLQAGFIDKIRNVFIGVGGILGISKIQWKCLCEGWLNLD
jgi:hypothetical protein